MATAFEKENNVPINGAGSRYHKDLSSVGKGSSGKVFGRLLTDATNQVTSEYDTRVAVNLTVDEAAAMMNEWIQENKDHDLAKKLTKSYEEEMRLQQKIELQQSEKEALKLAIEESRRARELEKHRSERAKADEQYARQLHEAESKESMQRESFLQDDEKLARQLSGEGVGPASADPAHVHGNAESKGTSRTSHKLQSKSAMQNNVPRDNKEDELTDDEEEEEEEGNYVHSDDEKDGSGIDYSRTAAERKAEVAALATKSTPLLSVGSAARSQKFDQLERDAFLARKYQAEYDADAKVAAREQFVSDAKLSQRISVKNQREDHRREKFLNVQKSFELSQRDEANVARMWEEAVAEVEDVSEAVCITLLLPNIATLNVTEVKRSANTIKIEAKRLVGVDTSAADKANHDNTMYVAEFRIKGHDAQLRAGDIHHDYSSESGLLHVYIEGVNLANNNKNTSARATYPGLTKEDAAAEEEAAARFIKRFADNPSMKKRISKTMTAGFKRLFTSSGSN